MDLGQHLKFVLKFLRAPADNGNDRPAREAAKVEHGMHITEFNVTLPAGSAYTRRQETWSHERSEVPVSAPGRTAVAARLNVLDTDRDGWLDADDVPYDQLTLLERERAHMPTVADAVAASYARAAAARPVFAPPASGPAAAPAPAAVAKERPQAVEAKPRPAAEVGSKIDLLA
jgi:hypothetical protein